jgi:hypothetical protein
MIIGSARPATWTVAPRLADDQMIIRHKSRHVESSPGLRLSSRRGREGRDPAGEIFIAARCDSEGNVIKGQEPPRDFWRHLAAGVNHIQNAPTAIRGRHRARSIQTRKNARYGKAEHADLLGGNTRFDEDICRRMIGDQKEIAIRTVPHRIYRQRIGDDGDQFERALKPMAVKVIEEMVAARVCGDDNARSILSDQVAQFSRGCSVDANVLFDEASAIKDFESRLPEVWKVVNNGQVAFRAYGSSNRKRRGRYR